uniref:nicotinamidase n=1 Tax=Arcella intermedia TaxID=1963864 RepID=A0A6B2LQF0_9EUKA
MNVPNSSIVIKKAFERTLDAYSAVQGGVLSRQGPPFDTEDTERELEGQLGLVGILKEVRVRRLFVVGIATDYCVKSTAIDAVRTGLVGEVVVVLPLTRWVSSITLELALLNMIASNVTIISEDPSVL